MVYVILVLTLIVDYVMWSVDIQKYKIYTELDDKNILVGLFPIAVQLGLDEL